MVNNLKTLIYKNSETIFITAVTLLLFALPQLSGIYTIYLTMHICMLSIFALGFNLLLGYTGLLSFGQAGFFAAGAYACGKILLLYPSLIIGFVGGVIFSVFVSFIIGFLCVRHTRIYFSMLTLSFGMMIYSIAWKWRDVTGGDDGLVGIPRAPISIGNLLTIDMSSMGSYYYFVILIFIASVYIMYRIVNSPFGLILRGIRENETRVSFAGVSLRKYRLLSFVIAGTYAGIAGALFAPLENTVTPVIAHWSYSAEPVLVTLLGGVNSFFGPIIGAILFFVIKDIVVRFTEHWLIIFGSVIVLLVMSFRGGVMSFINNIILGSTNSLVKERVEK